MDKERLKNEALDSYSRPGLEHRGMERFVIESSTALSKLGHVVTILTGKGRKDLELEGVKTIRSRIFFS
jgi:hypothetical protein